MRVGLLGGAFDPIHKGHLHMALQAQEGCGLDEVWLVPTGISPNKDSSSMTSAELRVAMASAAIGADWPDGWDRIHGLGPKGTYYPCLRVCTVEMDSDGVSYTYLTVQRLHERFSDYRFSFIMGADSLDYFDKWVHPERICAHASLLIVNRGTFTERALQEKSAGLRERFGAEIAIVQCEKFHAASHEIREALRAGERCEATLPEAVYHFIAARGLYGVPTNSTEERTLITT